MKFSVIIPTLNEEKLLPKLLEQLSRKKLREEFNYEIIVSDGGSKDNTIEFAKKYADIVVEHKEERRQSIPEGRNKGAEAATGDILIFINGDVTIEDVEKLFILIRDKFFSDNALAMTCKVVVNPSEEKISDIIFLGFYNLYFHFLNIIGIGMGRGECQVIKKREFEKVGGYNNQLAAGEDFDLFKRIRRNGKIMFRRDVRIFESPRRYRKQGHWKILGTWLVNSLFVFFKNKSVSKVWEEVR